MSAGEAGYIGIREATRLAGLNRKTVLRKLRRVHRRTPVLFKFSEAPNAKLWTTPDAMRLAFPERFGEMPQLDVLELRQMVMELEQRTAALERKVSAK